MPKKKWGSIGAPHSEKRKRHMKAIAKKAHRHKKHNKKHHHKKGWDI